MRTSLRTLVSVLLLIAAITAVSRAQSLLCIDSTAVPIDTMTVSTTVGGNAMLHSLSSGSTQIIWERVLLQTSSGRIDLVIDAGSISFVGDGWVVDAMSTPEIFQLIAETTLLEAIKAGQIPCQDSCTVTRVLLPACVERLGSGTATHFTPCGPECCVRRYRVCCPPGIEPIITLLSTDSPGCSPISQPECEPTCGGEEEGLLSEMPVSAGERRQQP